MNMTTRRTLVSVEAVLESLVYFLYKVVKAAHHL